MAGAGKIAPRGGNKANGGSKNGAPKKSVGDHIDSVAATGIQGVGQGKVLPIGVPKGCAFLK